MASNTASRRTVLKQLGLAGASLSIVNLPGWTLPALAQGETVVPFTDIPETFRPVSSATNRTLDIRKINGQFTPPDEFFTTQHYGHPEVDAAAFRLKVTGLVNKTLSLSLDDLKKLRSTDLVAGFECSGNSPRSIEGLASCGKWTGVPLKTLLDMAGVKAEAREFVFFGADHGTEEVEWRTQKFTVEQQFGRSLTREQVASTEPWVVWAMNGQPLTKHQGAPLRLVVPGWYGVANVKWLSQIHLQEDQYLGRFQARWYRTLKGQMIDGEMKWVESAITVMRGKAIIARVTTDGSKFTAHGYVLNDGTPIKSVDVKVDEGAWQPATIDKTTSANKYSWKLFTYTWSGTPAGDHTIVARLTDAKGNVQPTAKDLENKKSFLEDNSQFVRKIKI